MSRRTYRSVRPSLLLSLALHAGILAWAARSWTHLPSNTAAPPSFNVSWGAEQGAGLLVPEAPSEPPPAPAEAIAPAPAPALTESEPAAAPPAPVTTARTETAPATPATAALPKVGGRLSAPDKSRGAAKAGGLAGGGAVSKLAGAAAYLPPRYLTRSKPPYPPAARAQRLEGTVLVLVAVNAQGEVTRASLARSSGHAELDRAALESVRGGRFEPARQNGVAVAAEVELPVRFRLT